jgi:hypothetical protein
MAVVVRNDGASQAGSGLSNLLAVVLVLAAIAAVLYFVVPVLRGGASGTTFTLPSNVNVNTK